MTERVPTEPLKDPKWGLLILIFVEKPKLVSKLNTDFLTSTRGAHGEKIVLALALHLYNSINLFELSDLDYLDDENQHLALDAIHFRFKI